MKKLIIAVASISALSAGVHAATIETNTDGLALNVSGETEVQYTKDTAEDSDAQLQFNDVTLSVDSEYTTDSALTAIGSFELGIVDQDEASGALQIEEAYVGVGYDGATLTVGKQSFATDDYGIGKDFTFGADSQFGDTSGSDVIAASYSTDSYSLAVSTDIQENDLDASSIDVFATFSGIENVTIAGAFQSSKTNDAADSISVFGASGEYTLDAIGAAAEYSYNGDSNDMSYQVAGSYAVTPAATFSAGLGQTLYDNDDDTLTQYYVNAQYMLSTNVTAYAEIGGNSTDDSEVGYTAGMSVEF